MKRGLAWYAVRFIAGIVAIPLVAVLAGPVLIVMLIYEAGRSALEELS